MTLLELANTTEGQDELNMTAQFMQSTDPLFAAFVTLFKENKFLKARIEELDHEKKE
jgi:hypothetical protein